MGTIIVLVLLLIIILPAITWLFNIEYTKNNYFINIYNILYFITSNVTLASNKDIIDTESYLELLDIYDRLQRKMILTHVDTLKLIEILNKLKEAVIEKDKIDDYLEYLLNLGPIFNKAKRNNRN